MRTAGWNWIVLGTVALLACGCGGSRPTDPSRDGAGRPVGLWYSVRIPADVPDEFIWRDKHGVAYNKSSRVAMYVQAHCDGWVECRDRFLAGGIIPNRILNPRRMQAVGPFGWPDTQPDTRSPRQKMASDPESEFRPETRQELGLEWQARCDGFCQCHAELLALIAQRGEERVRSELAKSTRPSANK